MDCTVVRILRTPATGMCIQYVCGRRPRLFKKDDPFFYPLRQEEDDYAVLRHCFGVHRGNVKEDLSGGVKHYTMVLGNGMWED